MKRNTVLAVLLVAALPGGLLMGCSSDNADTASATTPPANPLVGTWLTEGPSDNPVIVLEMAADGTWTWSWGPSRDRVVDPGGGFGTYEVDGNTVTWLGGACDEGVKGIYTYTLENGQFTQTATDEPCDPRRSAYDGVTYTAEATPPPGAASGDQPVNSDSSQRYTLHPDGTTESPLGYTEYLPPTYQDGNSPLLVFLHGAGESGDGSAEHLSRLAWTAIPMEITRDRWPAERPFVVLAPQHDDTADQADYSKCEKVEKYSGSCYLTRQHDLGHPTPGSPCFTPNEIHDFITFALSTYDVDPHRVYLTGISCGAFGAWEYVSEYGNEQVAAAVPIAGEGRPAWEVAGCDLGNVALWAFHGMADDTVNPKGSVKPLSNLQDCPSPPRREALLTTYPDAGHDSWTDTYKVGADDDIYTWMLGISNP
jgi:poly(3-hydroxybutyrate) depolymerase